MNMMKMMMIPKSIDDNDNCVDSFFRPFVRVYSAQRNQQVEETD